MERDITDRLLLEYPSLLSCEAAEEITKLRERVIELAGMQEDSCEIIAELREAVERLKVENSQITELNHAQYLQLATAQLDNKELRDVLQVYWDQGISETFYYKVKQLLPLEPFNDSALRSYVAWEMRKMVEGSHRSATFSPFIIRNYADRYERGEV